ncbi:MAG: hydrogenase formation protein HypD [Bacteroidales bacterium]|nr:hydrogenase formation protein HypD [Bacteroidales bacterium]
MKFIDEYRNREMVKRLASAIRYEAGGHYRFMEVCGSHTHAVRRHGLLSLLPANIRLLSGPGCPVCVSDQSFIDKIIYLAGMKGFTITTFGDLERVPGNEKSLASSREEGADIRIVYSPLEALDIAAKNPKREVVFPAIGFETTAPATAITLQKARKANIRNFSVLSAHKIMPPAMHAVIDDGIKINGYICPGHVSSITGSKIYNVFPEKYHVAAVVAGFEPMDILQSVLMLVRQVNYRNFHTEIQYKRAVTVDGNSIAQDVINDVFEEQDDIWRGFGVLPKSGLKPREKYSNWNAEHRFDFPKYNSVPDTSCICGEILKGKKEPEDCMLFGKSCNPQHPVGACMVSPEGCCNAHFKYQLHELQD